MQRDARPQSDHRGSRCPLTRPTVRPGRQQYVIPSSRRVDRCLDRRRVACTVDSHAPRASLTRSDKCRTHPSDDRPPCCLTPSHDQAPAKRGSPPLAFPVADFTVLPKSVPVMSSIAPPADRRSQEPQQALTHWGSLLSRCLDTTSVVGGFAPEIHSQGSVGLAPARGTHSHRRDAAEGRVLEHLWS